MLVALKQTAMPGIFFLVVSACLTENPRQIECSGMDISIDLLVNLSDSPFQPLGIGC
jgi:hypothetical protein